MTITEINIAQNLAVYKTDYIDLTRRAAIAYAADDSLTAAAYNQQAEIAAADMQRCREALGI